MAHREQLPFDMTPATTQTTTTDELALKELEIATREDAFTASLPPAIDLTRKGTPAEVVVAIRRDLKAAVKFGVIPAHAKFSVRREDYNSIFVELLAWSGQVLNDEYHAHVMAGFLSKRDSRVEPTDFAPECREPGRQNEGCDARLTAEINRVMRLVGFLVNRNNYDHSDSQADHFDVGFYQTISARPLISAAEQGLMLELDPTYGDLVRRAHIAANRLGKACTKSFIGKSQIEAVGEYTLNTLIRKDRSINGLCYLDAAQIARSGGELAGLMIVAMRIAELAPRAAQYDKRRAKWLAGASAYEGIHAH